MVITGRAYIYIYIYITHTHICKKKQLYCMWLLWTLKNHIFFHTDIFWNCIPLSVYVCVKDTCWKFSICYKFTIKELLKLTKGITWRHSNIVLKLEKMKILESLCLCVLILWFLYVLAPDFRHSIAVTFINPWYK